MKRGVHDYGGLPAGRIDRTEHVYTAYEKRVDAIKSAIQSKDPRFTSDTSRRAQEGLPQDIYDNLPYYDRWLLGLRINLVELGHLTEAEIDERIAAYKRARP